MSWLGDEIKKDAATSRHKPEGAPFVAFHAMLDTDGLCSFVVEDSEDPKMAAGIVVDDNATSKTPRTGNVAGISG